MKQLRNSPQRSGEMDVPKARGLSGRRKASAKPATPDRPSSPHPAGPALRGATPSLGGGGYLEPGVGHVKAEPEGDTGKQLHEMVRHYEELYNLVPVSFVTLDKRGIILKLNERAARLLAFPIQWLLERSFLVFVCPRDVERFLSLLSRFRRAPDRQEIIGLDLLIGNELVPVQISIQPSIRDGRLIYQMAVVDLTEIKVIERELKETLNNWYSLVENAPDIIMTIDRKGEITFVNRDAWEYPISALVGTKLTDYVEEKDRTKLERCIRGAFESNQPSTCEVAGINGVKEHWYSFSFGPVRSITVRDANTTTVTIRDISQHKRTEQSLRESREQLREFAGRLDQVREEERTRVAREIHDELGQALTILKMDLAWVQGKTSPGTNGTRKKIKSMIADVDYTIERVRKIVSELRPSILDELGLTAAIEWQVSQFQERTGIRGVFESNTDKFNLSPEAAAALFRVVQEALTNVMRHADARQVRITLRSSGRLLRIAIADDGKGVARDQVNNRKSFGIVGMTERVHRIGGEFNIFSVPGRGTRLEIAVPLK